MSAAFTGCGETRCFERARVHSCHRTSKINAGFSRRGMFSANFSINNDVFRNLFSPCFFRLPDSLFILPFSATSSASAAFHESRITFSPCCSAAQAKSACKSRRPRTAAFYHPRHDRLRAGRRIRLGVLACSASRLTRKQFHLSSAIHHATKEQLWNREQ